MKYKLAVIATFPFRIIGALSILLLGLILFGCEAVLTRVERLK